MRILKNALFGLFIVAATVLLAKFGNFDTGVALKIVIGFLFAMFFFNLAVRRILWFRPYYISKLNILTGKFIIEKEYDLAKNLLFPKMIEVLNRSGFRVVKYEEDKGLILAISKMSWTSWGENIYVKLKESEKGTLMVFASATVFGFYSWGNNEENYYTLMANFDESLIIY